MVRNGGTGDSWVSYYPYSSSDRSNISLDQQLLHAGMSIDAVHGYKPMQRLETSLFLGRVLHERDQTTYSSHMRRLLASVVMVVAYGRRLDTLEDPRVAMNTRTERGKCLSGHLSLAHLTSLCSICKVGGHDWY